MPIRVDSYIVNAIDSYLRDSGLGYREFAQKTGVSPAAITKWRKVGNGITDFKWKQIFPAIKKYLPQDRIYINDAGEEQYSSTTEHISAYVFEPKYVPVTVPQVSFADMAKYDNIISSVMQFGQSVKAKMVEYYQKHSKKTGIISVVLDKRLPVFPFGANLFVCTNEQPQHNNFVLVKTVDNELKMGYFLLNGDTFSLLDLTTGDILLSGQIKNARQIIAWAFPILYYEAITF